MKKGILVLAGGKGSRMNYQDKSMLVYRGKRFIEIIKENFGTEKICAALKYRPLFQLKEIEYLVDENDGSGPIDGVINGFEKSDIDIFFVIGCDMPFINVEVFYKLLERLGEYDGVILADKKGFLYPLGAIYTRKMLDKMKQMRENKEYSLKRIFGEDSLVLSMEELGIEEKLFENINTINEYEELKGLSKS